MKRNGYILFFLFFVGTLFSQNKKTIDSINEISLEYKLKNSAKLEETYLKNVQNAKAINYHYGEAKAYSNLSLVSYYQGKYNKNVQYALKAISLFKKINDNENLALTYAEIGYAMKKRDLQKALYYMQKGKNIAEPKKMQKPLLSIYNNYGVLKEMQNDYDSALYFYNKGLILKQKINDKTGLPYSLNNIAGIYVIKKQFQKAIPYYKKALKMREELQDSIGVAENYSYFGDLYFHQNQYLKAIDYYKKTVEIAKNHNYVDLLQYSYEQLAKCYEKTNNIDLAYTNFKKFAQFKDSLINKETNSKIAELEVRFDTNEKEKIILQKEIESKRKSAWLIIISLLTLFTAVTGFLFFRQQKLKNAQQEQEFQLKTAIAQIETQNKLQEQRLSISRDLHDNIGAQLTFIISSVENLKFGYPNIDEKIKNQLTKVGNFTRETIIELRDTIWAMNSNQFTMEDLRIRLANFIEKAKSANNEIDFKFTIDDNLQSEKFSSVVGINIYRVIQEAVNNAMKYSNAQQIIINAKKIAQKIQITIQDNGKGFNIETIDFGNGLHNMKKRIEEIGGNFEINSIEGKGTKIIVEY